MVWKSVIIVIEGGDQAGKLTQSLMLKRALVKQNIKVKLFHFPDYKTPLGKEIKRYLDGKRKFPAQVIHCLLATNRWEKLDEIKSAQLQNSVLIMNRYYQSNLAYGIANGMKPGWLQALDDGLPKSDLVILLDVSQKESFQRQKADRDKFEQDIEFQKKISRIYKRLGKKHRWKIIDATKPKKDIHEEILKTFLKKIR